jgi:hypothetical protein
LIHGYLGIDDDAVWSIIQDDLPALLTPLRGKRENLSSPSPRALDAWDMARRRSSFRVGRPAL